MCGDAFWHAQGGIQCLTLDTAVANIHKAILCSWILRPQDVEGHPHTLHTHAQFPPFCVCCPYYFWRDEPEPYQSVFWDHKKWEKGFFSFPRAEVILMANYRHQYFCQRWPFVKYISFLGFCQATAPEIGTPHQSSNSSAYSLPEISFWSMLDQICA